MSYSWHWQIFLEPAGNKQIYLDWVIQGLLTTAQMGVLGFILAFVLGSVLGVMRTLERGPWAALATAYVEVARNVPLIVQLFLWYYLVPRFLPEAWRTWLFAQPPALTAFATSTLGLGFFTAARVCEQVRAGITSIPQGQRHAALALGLTLPKTYRCILMPMAYRTVVPPLTSEMLSIFKNSSIAATVGVIDLFARTRQLNEYTARAYESFIAVIACYLLINLTVIVVMGWVERRVRVPGYSVA